MSKPFEMLERTAQFGESVIRLLRKVPETAHNRRIIDQLTGAGTSVGANFCEADNAVSSRDFRKSAGFCRKEARETKFFLRMLACAQPQHTAECTELSAEADELLLILSKMIRNSQASDNE